MLAAFRAVANSWFGRIMFGLLALAFVGWGASTRFGGAISGKSGDDVIRAGHSNLTSPEFKRIFGTQLQRLVQEQGRDISADEAVQGGFDRMILEKLEQSMVIGDLARRLGMHASAKQTGEEIVKNPQFTNPVTRQFDQKSYDAALLEIGVTKARYEDNVRSDLGIQQLAEGLGVGFQTPKLYGAVVASLQLQQRDVAYFSIDPKAAGVVAPPTDAQLAQYIKDNADQLRRPEFRLLSLVRFSAAAEAKDVQIDPAKVQQLYDARKNQLSVAEKRSFVQIPVKSPAEVKVVAARLSKGDDPAKIAKDIGAQPLVYTDAPKTAVPDPKIADAAFAMPEGQVQPAQGQYGSAVIKVTKITLGKAATLEDARPQIEQALREEAARNKVYAEAQKYGDTHDAGGDLHKAAQVSGAKVYAVGPITADGKLPNGQPVPALTPDMLKQAFSKPQGGETDLTQLQAGEYYALRVEKVIASAVPPLAEIRAPLAQHWMQAETIKRMQAKSEQLAAAVRGGKTLEAAAASVGTQVVRVAGMGAQTQQENQKLGQTFLAKVFASKANVAFTAQGPGFAMSVAEVTAVHAANPGYASFLADYNRQKMNPQMSEEMDTLAIQYAKAKIKPKIDHDKALAAINVTPPATPGAAKSGAAKAGRSKLAQ